MNNKPLSIVNTPHFPLYLLSFIIAILNSCVLSPIYIQIENNIAFEYTALPIILNYLVLLFDTAYIALLFASLSYSIYAIHKGQVSKKSTAAVIFTIVFLKHTLNLLASSVIDGYIDISFDIPMTLYMILIDLLMLSVVAIVANQKCKTHFEHAKAMIKASKYIQTVEYSEQDEIFPFKSFIRIKKHPILLPIFLGAILSSGLLVAQRLFADFVVLDSPSTLFEIFDIVISYATDILFGLVCYTVSYFAVTIAFLKDIEESDNQ